MDSEKGWNSTGTIHLKFVQDQVHRTQRRERDDPLREVFCRKDRVNGTLHLTLSREILSDRLGSQLNGGTLDGNNITVTSDTEHEDEKHTGTDPVHHIEQTDKPRAGSEPFEQMTYPLALIHPQSLRNISPEATPSRTKS